MTTAGHAEGIRRSNETGILARFITRCKSAMDVIVPVGYEDETEFHYGRMPSPPPSTSAPLYCPEDFLGTGI